MTENESANCRMEANYSHQQELDMIPLMLTEGFKPKGWLGLILGTRIWYPLWGADAVDDSAFERRLDSVVREIGDRGKLMLPESVPPFREPTPEPAPALAATRTPAPAPALAPAPAPVTPPRAASTAVVATTTADRSFSPTMQMMPSPTAAPQQAGGSMVGSLADLSAFMEKQQHMMKEERQIMEAKVEAQHQEQQAQRQEQQAREDRLREDLERVKHEMEVKTEQQRADAEAQRRTVEAGLREEVERAKPQAASEAISAVQLEALQARLQALHTAKLLTEDELGNLEDTIADCVEVLPTADVKDHAVGQTVRMVLLSERMQVDGSFARQLKRKFA